MATGSHGYEPARLTALASRTGSAIDALASITSTDPAAADAMVAVRGLHALLRDRWAPAVATVRTANPLGGQGHGMALGGNGSGGTWEYDIDARAVVFVPSALSELFPGDDDITAEEIAAKLEEILEHDPSEQQADQLLLLGKALDEIAADPELSTEVVIELGPDGIAAFYDRIYVLGIRSQFGQPTGYPRTGDGEMIDPDLMNGLILPFGEVLVVASNRDRRAADILVEVIDATENAFTTRDMVVLEALARSPGLAPVVAEELFQRVRDQEQAYLSIGLEGDNRFFQTIPEHIGALVALTVAGNPGLVDTHIFDGDRFVDGGEKLLGDIIETEIGDQAMSVEVDQAIGHILQRIIDQAPPTDRIILEPNQAPTGEGVIFDLVRILLDHDLKVGGLATIEALAPYLPDVTGAYPNSPNPFTADEIRAMYQDLFYDLTPAEAEQALLAILAGAIHRIDDLDPQEFGDSYSDAAISEILEGVLGPAQAAVSEVVSDKEAQAAMWERVLNQAFGLIPLPGGKVASLAFREAFKLAVGEAIGVDRSVLDIADQIDLLAVDTALVTVCARDDLRDEIVAAALDDWESTAGRLRTGRTNGQQQDDAARAARDLAIEQFRIELERSLEPGARALDFNTFLELPEVRDLAVDIHDRVTR